MKHKVLHIIRIFILVATVCSLYCQKTRVTENDTPRLGVTRQWLEQKGISYSEEELESLKKLSLRGASLMNEDLTRLKPLQKLEQLDLSWNRLISNFGLIHLKPLHNLQSLNMRGTNITDDGLHFFSVLSDLHTLSLPSTITDKGLQKLLGVKGLQTLILHGKYSGQGICALSGMTQLRTLDLSGVVVQYDELSCLGKHQVLETLVLPVYVPDDFVAKLARALPECTIRKSTRNNGADTQ